MSRSFSEGSSDFLGRRSDRSGLPPEDDFTAFDDFGAGEGSALGDFTGLTAFAFFAATGAGALVGWAFADEALAGAADAAGLVGTPSFGAGLAFGVEALALLDGVAGSDLGDVGADFLEGALAAGFFSFVLDIVAGLREARSRLSGSRWGRDTLKSSEGSQP